MTLKILWDFGNRQANLCVWLYDWQFSHWTKDLESLQDVWASRCHFTDKLAIEASLHPSGWNMHWLIAAFWQYRQTTPLKLMNPSLESSKSAWLLFSPHNSNARDKSKFCVECFKSGSSYWYLRTCSQPVITLRASHNSTHHMLYIGRIHQVCMQSSNSTACKDLHWENRLFYLQGDPIEWASSHRYHHLHTDTPMDPHSPYEGFWWSHMGWLLDNEVWMLF